jgi:hypothetical protein
MCTVTFVNHSGNLILTSNRDEKITRPRSMTPHRYSVGTKEVLFPKDPKAGGTWYALDSAGNVVVLLNGATEKHETKGAYRKSRGLIVLEMIAAADCLQYWDSMDLLNIEPFTLVVLQHRQLYQLRWNGHAKKKLHLDSRLPYIWSSVTLYPQSVRAMRERWFFDFLKKNTVISQQQMFDFHQMTAADDPENGLVINRDNLMVTQSITQTYFEADKIRFSYRDLLTQTDFQQDFPTTSSTLSLQ